MSDLQPTRYYPEFLRYLGMAKILQDKVNLGGLPIKQLQTRLVPDDLMRSVTIYDTVERRHAGFSNMLMDLWHADKTPKFYKKSEAYKKLLKSFKHLRKDWDAEEWIYAWLVHRITGSGASFESDHGYRNTPMFELAKGKSVRDMHQRLQRLQAEKIPIFTSIGNQPPLFSPGKDGMKPGLWYLVYEAPLLATHMANWLAKRSVSKRRASPRDVVDEMNAWNNKRGHKKFTFQFAAVAGDMADYWPKLVDPDGDFYHGKNAIECSELLFEKPRGRNLQQFLDDSIRHVCRDFGGGGNWRCYPYDIEDGLCDGIRWLENYVPRSTMKTYDHLDLDSVFNSCKIQDHPKGRQKMMLTLGVVDTFNDRKPTADYAVLERAGMSAAEYIERARRARSKQ